MKHFTFKWLKRLYILIAIKLVLIALLLTVARILFISVEDYKQQAMDWLTTEYQVNISVQDISAGIDFSGMVLILNNVELLDSEELPFDLNFEYLFLHLDFWDSVTAQKLNFNRISLQGANLTLHNSTGKNTSKKSQITIDKLKDIFLTQLKKVSVKESTLNYTDKFGIDKVINIEQLRWLNEQGQHQGIGQASFPNALGGNSLKFVVNVFPQKNKKTISGNIYLQADNLNITDYMVNQVNVNAKVTKAIVGFDAWATFSNRSIDRVQVEFTNNQLVWTQLNKDYNWNLNYGAIQLTNQDNGWLLDSYDLLLTNNNNALAPLKLSGKGDISNALFNFEGLTVKDILPFYSLYSGLSEKQITSLGKFDIDANIKQLSISLDSQKALQFSLQVDQFKNRPVGGVPGISNASISLQGGLKKGRVDIELGKQKIYFDGQFSRSMPLKSANIDLQWQQTETGLKLFSEQTLLTTDELDTITEFSLFLPNEKAQNSSAFLSLYSYASLNDASKARYYFPIKVMGQHTYDYLEPTLKKGQVKGAEILWYGAVKQYPYRKNNGIFQAFIPLRDAQYDFYGDWQGLTNLDLDLLFENDYLLMNAKKGNLGAINVHKLMAKIDHLNPRGILTIKADINDDASKISAYLQGSPIKDSVGKALSVIDISEPLEGNITLTIPFDRRTQKTTSEGTVFLKNNTVDLHLTDDIVMPLKKVNGSFEFKNGQLSAKNMNALLFEQPIELTFTTQELQKKYQIDAQVNGLWDLATLSHYHKELAPLHLSGALEWSGAVSFSHKHSGGYQYEVTANSATQGVSSKLPTPFYKHTLESWPTTISLSGNDSSSHLKVTIKDKLDFDGELNYQQGEYNVPYFTLNLGLSDISFLDKTKQVINLNTTHLNVADWYKHWLTTRDKEQQNSSEPNGLLSLLALDEVNVVVKQLNLFNQPLADFRGNALHKNGKWDTTINSDNVNMQLEYRSGIPVRFDVHAEKINLQTFDLSLLKNESLDSFGTGKTISENLLDDYPELFIDCEICIYKKFDLSPLSVHIYPTKKRLNIDYIKVGDDNEFTTVSGFWDQRLTNIIFDTEGDRDHDLIKRLGYVGPLYYQKAQLSGAANWRGAPWQANLETLNGAFSAEINDGAITEVSDKGARLLSAFSLDGIYRSLNLEFDNVFAKGFNFDKLTFSGNIHDGVISNDDFYLTGSPGKITGNGLVDLLNQDTNYNFSYSPAVTSSLPVLAAFAINPLTGAAVLMLTKLLEPVVDTIIRVDFSVKGNLAHPEVKLVTRQRGKIKLENSEVLHEMTEQQKARVNNNDK